MVNLIQYDRKSRIFKYLNLLLLLLFSWVVIQNTLYFFEKIIFGDHENFYDLKLIYNSLIDTLNNKNTYKIYPPYFDQPTTSVPPYILILIKDLGNLTYQSFIKIFIFLEILAIIFLFFYSYKLFSLKEIKLFYPFIYFFSFNFSLGLAGTVVGNIAVLLYSLIGISLFFLYKKKIFLFSLLIFIVSCFKFYLLIFFFLPLVLYGLRTLKYIAPYIFLIFLINYSFYINNPILYNSWVELMQIQVSRSPDNPWVGSDITQVFAALIWTFGNYFNIYLYPSTFLSNFFWITITTISFISFFFIYGSKALIEENRLKILSFAIILIFLFYPRILIYDLFLVIPAFYYLASKIIFAKNRQLNSIIKFTLFLFFLCVQDTHAWLCSLSMIFFLIIYLEFKNKNPMSLK